MLLDCQKEAIQIEVYVIKVKNFRIFSLYTSMIRPNTYSNQGYIR